MILAIDTATKWTSLALSDETAILAEHTWRTLDNHTVEVAPAIESMLNTNGISVADLNAVAVALGPGSFTALRIGLGLAKGLAVAHNMSIVGVPTHDIIAFPQPQTYGSLFAVLQMGRARIAVSQYRLDEQGWVASKDPIIATWDDLASAAKVANSENVYVCGEVDKKGVSILADHVTIATASMNMRRASYLAEIAQARLASGESDDPSTLVPIYLQQPPTETNGAESKTHAKVDGLRNS